jgi:molecular chaperone DnaK
VQLEIKYEATSVETTELVNIKVLKDKSTGTYPAELFAEFVRTDGAWSNNKIKISDTKAALGKVALVEGRSNTFNINVYDEQGNRIDCEPNQFTILQGIGGLDGMQVLPSHICIVKHFADEEKDLIEPVKGLGKISRYPATGVTNGLKTRQPIRPGMAKDIIRIPIYEGEYNAPRTNPDLNNLIFEVVITGESLPALLPEGSDVDITIKVDKSGLIKFSAYFPLLDYTEELEIPHKPNEVPDTNELTKKIANAKRTAKSVNANDIYDRLDALEKQLENEKGSADGKLKIINSLCKELLQLETLEKAVEWPAIEQELKDAFFDFEDFVRKIKANEDTDNFNIDKINAQMQDYKQKVDAIIKDKNKSEAKALSHEIFWVKDALIYEITEGKADIGRIQWHDHNFSTIKWKDSQKARTLINMGLQAISKGETLKLRPILHQIWDLRVDRVDDGETLE